MRRSDLIIVFDNIAVVVGTANGVIGAGAVETETKGSVSVKTVFSFCLKQ